MPYLIPLFLLTSFAPLPKPEKPVPLDCTGDKGVSAADVKKAQQAWAKYLSRHVEEEDEIAKGVKMKFVLVPPGKYLMGSPPGEAERDEDEVQHEVTITKPFYLGKYTVTQTEYEAVVGKNPSHFKGANLPVERVSWDDATAFARKLSGKTTAVGTFGANALGLQDMHGNVWQWCGDWYGEYRGKATDVTGPQKGSDRVIRGGCWGDHARFCRSAARNGFEPGGRSFRLGFRLARIPSPPGK